MSREMGNGKSKNIPPPPPPPPPLKTLSKERLPKLKTKELFSRNSPTSATSKKVGSKEPSLKSPAGSKESSLKSPAGSKNSPYKISNRQSPKAIPLPPPPPPNAKTKPTSSTPSIQDGPSADTISSKGSSRSRKNVESVSVVEIVRNDVPFFDEENCTDSEDEFAFPCCLQPNSPRYPPNPRPYREWDPSFLPSSTNIPTSIGRKCRRCGKPVYVAELYLSSRGVYHSECYKCCLCGKTLDSWSVAEFKGEVFCKGCYRRNFGTHGCGFGVGAGVLQTP